MNHLSSGSQEMVSESTASPGNLLEIQISDPTPDLNQKLWARSPEICVVKALLVMLVHYIRSLVLATDFKKRNCLSGSCAAQSVIEVRVQLCKDSATEDYQAAAPGREALCFVLSLAERQGPCKLKVDGWRGEKLTGSDIYIFLFCYRD